MKQQTGALRAKHANFNANAIDETRELTSNKADLQKGLADEEVRRGQAVLPIYVLRHGII